MGKVQFFYDPLTCNYEQINPSNRRFIRKLFYYVLAALILAAGSLYILSQHYPTPKETQLEIEQKNLELKWSVLEKELSYINVLVEALWIHDEEIRIILELDSLPRDIRMAGIGGSESYQDLLNKRLIYEKKIVSAYDRIEKLKAKLNVQDASFDTLISYANERDIFWASLPAIQPVENRDLRRVSTIYGMRLHPIYKKWMPHRGLDFMGNTGVPIYATGDGEVRLAQMTYGGFGNLIEIDHGYGYSTRYAHLHGFNVKKGQIIKRGDLIGYMGNTGRSAGIHLHYEVLKNGVQVNPIGFFERELSDEALAKMVDRAKLNIVALD